MEEREKRRRGRSKDASGKRDREQTCSFSREREGRRRSVSKLFQRLEKRL